jgi:tripartite-type tricarboxylate transporter receptor subunit TctC
MHPRRRHLLALGGAAAAPSPTARGQGTAADWPTRPVRIIVPFPPGGPNDIIARLYAPQLSAILRQPVVIENRAGAGGLVGTDAALKAAPDGYTFAITNGGSLVISPHVATVPYRVPEEMTLISVVTRVPEALVANPRLGVRTLPELIALARREPGRLNIGTAGAAGLSHLAAELFKAQAGGLDIVVVPYRGAAPAVTDIIGGQIQLLFADLPVILPHIRGGTLTALAMAAERRSPVLPDLPTTGELGLPGMLAENWYCMVGPPRLPEPILARMSAALRQAAATPELRDGLAAQGGEAAWTTQEEFAALVRTESARWDRIARAANIRAD